MRFDNRRGLACLFIYMECTMPQSHEPVKLSARSAIALLFVCAMSVAQVAQVAPEALEVSVSAPKQISHLADGDDPHLIVSPSGAVAAFVITDDWLGRRGERVAVYRVSYDGGVTWTGQFQAPVRDAQAKAIGGGDARAMKIQNGVSTRISPWKHMTRPIEFFESRLARFSDDLMEYQIEMSQAAVKEAVVAVPIAGAFGGLARDIETVNPLVGQDRPVRISEREQLMAVQCKFEGDSHWRSIVLRSLDGGRMWRYLATIASGDDPDADMAGDFTGYSEPSLARLDDGRLLCVMRVQGSLTPPYKPLYQAYSQDEGQTWSQPQPFTGMDAAVCPRLVSLENGVIACAAGMPGLQVALSADGGQTWGPALVLSQAQAPQITGQIDMIQAAANQLVMLAGVDAVQGTCAFTIAVGAAAMQRVAARAEEQPLPSLGDQEMNITVGESVQVGTNGHVNTASLGVSRTGVLIASVPNYEWPNFEGWQWPAYRVSADGGQTWTPPMEANRAIMGGGGAWATLRGGGVMKHAGGMYPIPGREDWFDSFIAIFSDDGLRYDIEPCEVYVPNAELTYQEPSPHVLAGPVFDKGKIQQLPNGDLLAPMYGRLKGRDSTTVMMIRSSDRGKTWRLVSEVAYADSDPDPQLPGEFQGFSEPSLLLLPGGEMICVMRAGGWGELRTMYICWSQDEGKTWSTPQPTEPGLYSIWPTLQLLDNGVIACVHGRPNFEVSFSMDKGKSWARTVRLLPEGVTGITGQVDMIKSGPHTVLAIGGGGSAGTIVTPITVEVAPGPRK
jgi:hypothetical protein